MGIWMGERLRACRFKWGVTVGILCLAFVAGVVSRGFSADGMRIPDSLLQALVKTGVTREEANRFLNPAVVSVNVPIILKNLTHHERKEDYQAFLKRERIERSRQFLARHQALLSGIERAYGVPKEVVVAILLVESDLGRHHERYSVLEVYASLASLIDSKVRFQVSRRALQAGLDPRSAAFRRRVNRKAAWGLRQLSCLIRLGRSGVVDITKLKGSWAGAFGIPQFIPTSVEEYGVDWDRDGAIRLDTLPDAAASAANYLKKAGWTGRMTRQQALAVTRRYNHSQPYAETILEIARRLEKR